MPVERYDLPKPFERGVVMLSLDTEQIWGYFDHLNEAQFQRRYPDAYAAQDKLLACLQHAGISATWFVVGGMALHGTGGANDRRTAGLPWQWIANIPAGDEESAPLWYRHAFVQRLRQASPLQEIGLHGGLTHLIWTHAHTTPAVARWELAEGVKALELAQVQPLSFSFGREQEAYPELLPACGIRCYRGRTVTRAFQLGPTLQGKLARLFDELRCSTPPIVWPRETLPGLWNIPSSLFLYPIGASRTKVIGLRSRVERFRRGVEAAARQRGIFHFCLHPENLTESPHGFDMFEEMLQCVRQLRDRGDVQVMTMGEVAARMQNEKGQTYDAQKQFSHSRLLEADRRSRDVRADQPV